MTSTPVLSELAEDIADDIPSVDAETKGQYGDGIGSENEERQMDLLMTALRERDPYYKDAQREVPYPTGDERCDLILPDGTPVEAKLLRIWRANGDQEDYMYTHVYSPFHENTLMTDAKDLYDAGFDQSGGLLGLFYDRGRKDSTTVISNPELFTAKNLAQKVVDDIEYWYDFTVNVAKIAPFDGLQHSVQRRGAVITWSID